MALNLRTARLCDNHFCDPRTVRLQPDGGCLRQSPMRFFRQYRFQLLFFALLVFCVCMVVYQLDVKRSKHSERRTAFILLYSRGYTNEAARLYQRLLLDVAKLSEKELFDDFQSTLTLVDPFSNQTNNLLWSYHWTISNELDRRSERTLKRARELAEEK